jgi:ankyrin repeat protein
MMNKSISIVLSIILVVTFLGATSQEIEKHGKEWIRAIMFGKIDEVNKLIEAGVDVNRKFDLGASRDITPLYFAVLTGEADMGKLLIDAGADVDINFKGVNLLHVSGIYGGNEAVTELLIANGLDVNAKTKHGETPLDLGISKGHNEIVDLLRKHGGISGKEQNQ